MTSSTPKRKGLSKLKSIKRKSITLSKENLVKESFVNDKQLPIVFEPVAADLDLPTWAGENRDDLRAKLYKHGALLFRGFKVENIEQFQAAVIAVSGDLLNYTERSSPRHSVKGKVYTSTDYPPNQSIFLHNEQSYNVNWCRTISFFCAQPSETGGQTPIADTRRILARLDKDVVERFKVKGYMYMRNFGDGFGLEWQTTFGTEDKAAVEAYCRANAIEFEWKDGNRLRTRQVRSALHHHPVTQEPVWFNHCTFFNVRTLPEQVQENLLGEFAEDELPNHTFYGDGTPIEPEIIKAFQQAYLDEKVMFDWQKGDVLIIDNMLSSHAREPFTGDRSVLVAMSELTDNKIEDLGKGV